MSDHCSGQLDVVSDGTIHRVELGDLQEVEVDRRALANMLSRYPGTFDGFRELIQNADDAEARNIEVHFQIKGAEKFQPASKLDVSKLEVDKWIIKDDGNGFKDKDWERLGKIGAGNDDPTKVGAFGVGFYTVLSKSDQPLVRSKGKLLQFYKGEDGNFRRLREPKADDSPDPRTSVELKLRDPEPLPVLADLAKFLASSVAFLTNINAISVHLHLDSQLERVLYVQKQVEHPVVIPIPQHLKPRSPLETLRVESIERVVQRVVVDTVEWAFTSGSTPSFPVGDMGDTLVERHLEEHHPTRTSQSTDAILKDNAIAHDLYKAKISVNLHPDSEMKKGVKLCMKSLPTEFECKAVYFNPGQYDFLGWINNSDSPEARHLARFFCGSQGIFPEKNSGRLFIGQSTNQTTGIGLHISAHFLPTMERGAVDFANGQVKAWNEEVLHVGGFLARVIYEEEMNAAKSKGDDGARLGLRTMDRFAFGPTAPHSGVSTMLQDAFFSCCHGLKSPLPVVSDAGISCALKDQFRRRNVPFLKTYRVIHEDAPQCPEIISRYNIPELNFEDIVEEFASGASQDAMRSFFRWWEDVRKNPPPSLTKNMQNSLCRQFSSRAVLCLNHGVKIALKNIKYFTFFPLPNDLSHPDNIYVDVTPGVPTRDTVEGFGWTQLSLLEWLEHVRSPARQLALNEDSGQVSDVGYRILRALIQFALVKDLSLEQWDRAAGLMKDVKCVPTNMGLQLPANSYFDVVDVCRSLPVVKEDDFMDIEMDSLPVLGKLEHIGKVLASIHVRAMMTPTAWEDMIGRLEKDASKESNFRLLRYLDRKELTDQQQLEEQVNDLKRKRVFYSENHGLQSANELLLPNEDVRKLGLPTLALPQDDMSGPDQFGPLVESLGIQRYPALHKIIAQAASSDEPEVRRAALQYLLSNLDTLYNDYNPENFAEIAFIPTECGLLVRPNEVFASGVWEQLGFKQVSQDLRPDLSGLGVKQDPSVDTIIEYLKTPERTLPDLNTAAIWFKHLDLHAKLSTQELSERLSKIPFVPVKNPGSSSSESSSIKYICPTDCFITSTETKDHYRQNFLFVDFGQNGNSFLESCSAKKSPDASDILRKIAKNPQSYLEALGNNIKLYLDDLRTIASQLDSISEDDKQGMKKAAMFLAEENGVVTEKLLLAEQVFISDWAGRDFARQVSVVPKGDILEKMYHKMGSTFLGTHVKHVVTAGSTAKGNPPFRSYQVILRIRHFMDRRDEGGKTGISFGEQGATHNLRVGACKSITVKKTFAPPSGVLVDAAAAGTIETKSVPVEAAFELSEDGKSYTLGMVSGSESVHLHDHIAAALCQVLLKTYGPNDMLLLASLFGMSDKSVRKYYGTHGAKVNSKKLKVQLLLPPCLAKLAGVSKARGSETVYIPTTSAEQDMKSAIALWGKSDPNGKAPDPDVPSRRNPTSPQNYNDRCKQAHTIRLRERKDLRDEKTGIQFFMAQDVRCQQPPRPALEEFAKLISCLANVFGLKASTACYIFWKDTDRDLMAFNRDREYIFLNLANYHRFFYIKGVEKKKVITDWYLIMAHEIAHRWAMEHDELHGSLFASLAIEHLPALHRQFPGVSWENEQQPQSTSNASD